MIARRTFSTTLLLLLVAAVAAGCGGGGEKKGEGGGGGNSGGSGDAGKRTFVQSCGGCHTLGDAGTSGAVGPNLDDLKPDRDTVLNAIKTGPGGMPENIVEGEDAEQVADYVAKTAG